MRFSLARILVALVPCAALAQAPATDLPDKAIDAAVRSEVISASASALEKSYVFPGVRVREAEAGRPPPKPGTLVLDASVKHAVDSTYVAPKPRLV